MKTYSTLLRLAAVTLWLLIPEMTRAQTARLSYTINPAPLPDCTNGFSPAQNGTLDLAMGDYAYVGIPSVLCDFGTCPSMAAIMSFSVGLSNCQGIGWWDSYLNDWPSTNNGRH